MSPTERSAEAGPLVCPRCAISHSLDERFCRDCSMPLVYAGRDEQEPITEAHERARKIKPQYTQGEVVRVAGGRNQAEAELIQGLLLEEGIPSIVRRQRGFDVPDFLAAGPRDVMVPEAAYETARTLLTEAEIVGEGPEVPGASNVTPPMRVFAGLLAGLLVVTILVWIIFVVTA